MTTPADAMRARLRGDLAAAMAHRKLAEAKVLRSLIAAVDNAEAVPVAASGPYRVRHFGDPDSEVPRRHLEDAAVAAVVAAEAAEREAAAEQYDAAGETGRAADLRAAAAMVRSYLAT